MTLSPSDVHGTESQKFKEISCPDAAPQVENCLRHSSTLAQILLDGHRLKTGKITAIVPESVLPNDNNRVNQGGLLAQPHQSKQIQIPGGKAKPVPNSNTYLQSVIKSAFENNDNETPILQDDNSRPESIRGIDRPCSAFVSTMKSTIFLQMLNSQRTIIPLKC